MTAKVERIIEYQEHIGRNINEFLQFLGEEFELRATEVDRAVCIWRLKDGRMAYACGSDDRKYTVAIIGYDIDKFKNWLIEDDLE